MQPASVSNNRVLDFNKKMVRMYLKYGSVDRIFRINRYNLPISYPGLHHMLDRWGIVKSVGPNSTLSETITILSLYLNSGSSVSHFLKKLPSSLKSPLSTFHKILHNLKEGIIRRTGTALVITLKGEKTKVLLAEDITPRNLQIGKVPGYLTVPVTYSKEGEDPRKSILRVLQQEVFTDDAVDRYLDDSIIPNSPKPFMFLNIADIKIQVFHLEIDKKYLKKHKFSSQKIINHKFVKIEDAKKLNLRMGVDKILTRFIEVFG